jgi:hypothetical protein
MWVKMEPEEFCDEQMLHNYKRNEQLVDLSFTPKHITDSIIEQYDEQSGKGRTKLFNYFVERNLRNLMESIGDF